MGLEGRLTSSTSGTDLDWLIGTAIKPSTCDISVTRESFADTGFAATPPIAVGAISGLDNWSGSFSGPFPKAAPASGHTGFVTFASGYAVNVTGWSLSASVQMERSTALADTPPTWDSFLPGLYSFTGSYDALIDGTTSIALPSTGAASFRISTEATNDNVLAGNIVITGMAPGVNVSGKNIVKYTFTVNGNMTTVGDGSFLEPASASTATALIRPELTTIVLRASGSKTYTGGAYASGWTIGAAIGSPVVASVNFQGSGALVLA